MTEEGMVKCYLCGNPRIFHNDATIVTFGPHERTCCKWCLKDCVLAWVEFDHTPPEAESQ